MTPDQIDPNIDVIVVGAGNAAMNAALAGTESGASVVMFEAAPESARSGNSAFTGGAFRFVYEGVDDLLRLAPDIADLDLANIDFGPSTREQYINAIGHMSDRAR